MRRLTLSFAVVVAFAAFGTAAAAADTPTPKQLVARITRAATKPGQVLHTTTRLKRTVDPTTIAVWIDLDRGLVRQQVGSTIDGGSALLIAGGRQYLRFGSPSDKDGPARDCMTAGITASLVAPCTWSHENTRTVATGTRDGHSVLVLDSDLSNTSKNFAATGTSRVWVDAKTSLPVAFDTRTKATFKMQVIHEHITGSETHEFVPAGSLPDDFFTVQSVTAWAAAAHAGGAQAAQERQKRLDQRGPVRGTGTLSDGSTWTVEERTDGSHPCFEITITTGAASGGGGCAGETVFDRKNLPKQTSTLRGHPPVVMVTAPRGTKAIELTARLGKHGEAVHLTDRHPIKSSAGFVGFVVELPAGAHANAAKVVNF